MGQRHMKNQRKQNEHETEREGHKAERVLIMKIEGLGVHQWNVPNILGWVLGQCYLDCKFRNRLWTIKYEN